MNKQIALSALVLAIIAGMYWQVLELGYVWDDGSIFVNQPALRSPELVWAAIWQPILAGTSYLRPVVLGSFALQFLWLGDQAIWAHAINLVLHLMNVGLVIAIAHTLLSKTAASPPVYRPILAGLLYGLHPVLVEPVSWASGRFDLMLTLFSLLAILAALRLAGWQRVLTVSLFFLLAALSKEAAAVLPALVFIVLLSNRDVHLRGKPLLQEIWRKDGKLYVGMFLTGLAYVVARKLLIENLTHRDWSVMAIFPGWIDRLALVGNTLHFYLLPSVWPFNDLSPMHLGNYTAWGTSQYVVGVGSVVVALMLVAVLIRRGGRQVLWIGWLVALLPVLNIVPLTMGGNIGQERFLTLPMVFAVLALVSMPLPTLSPDVRKLAGTGLAGLGLMWVAFSMLTIHQMIPFWKSDLTLWNLAYSKYPENNQVRTNYVESALFDRYLGLAEKALQRWEQSGQHVDNLDYHLAMSRYFTFKGDIERAGKEADIADRLLKVKTGRLAAEGEALASEAAIAAYGRLGQVRLLQGQFKLAESYLLKALAYSPRHQAINELMGFALYGQDRPEDAERAFAQAKRSALKDAVAQVESNQKNFIEEICRKEGARTPRTCAMYKQAAK